MRDLIHLPIGMRGVTMKGEMKEEEIGGMIGEKIEEKKEEVSTKGIHLGGTLHLALQLGRTIPRRREMEDKNRKIVRVFPRLKLSLHHHLPRQLQSSVSSAWGRDTLLFNAPKREARFC